MATTFRTIPIDVSRVHEYKKFNSYRPFWSDSVQMIHCGYGIIIFEFFRIIDNFPLDLDSNRYYSMSLSTAVAIADRLLSVLI